MANRSTSNKRGEVSKVTETEGNTIKRNEGTVTATDTTPTSEPLAEQPEGETDAADESGDS